MNKRDAKEPTGSTRLDRALRLIFERKGDKVRLVSAQRLHMIVPPPQALSPMRAEQSSWFELRDGGDRPVYRRAIEDPLGDLEVVVDDPEQPLQRVALGEARGAFFLIVPDIEGARRLVLRSASYRNPEAKRGKRRKGKGEREATDPSLLELDLSKLDRKER
jgi:hypothetical protein